jgi:inner membrane protein COX18
MAAGILLRSSSAVSTTPLTPSAVPTKKPALGFGQRLGLSFSLIFGIAATQFPAAVLLYLVPSMTMGWLQTRWLDVKYPIPGVVEPCKKPVRFKVRKEFDMPA